MLKRKITKHTGKLDSRERKTLVCKECNIVTILVSGDIGEVTCAYCVQKMVAPPDFVKPKSENEKFPRGWHFKQRYVHKDGRVFCKGVDTGEVVTPEPPKKKVVKKKTPKKKRT